jgi:hypothetical protein
LGQHSAETKSQRPDLLQPVSPSGSQFARTVLQQDQTLPPDCHALYLAFVELASIRLWLRVYARPSTYLNIVFDVDHAEVFTGEQRISNKTDLVGRSIIRALTAHLKTLKDEPPRPEARPISTFSNRILHYHLKIKSLSTLVFIKALFLPPAKIISKPVSFQ